MVNKATISLAIFFACTLLCSCSALTKSQKATFQAFAASAKSYAETPTELVNTYSECLYQHAQLRAATNSIQQNMINDLDLLSKNYFSRTDFNSELSITYQLMSKYFQALLDFLDVDSSKEFKTNIATLGTNVDSLASKLNTVKKLNIPLGFGDLGALLVQYIGKKQIRHKQLIYFKQFIAKGDSLIEQASLVLNDIVIGALISGEIEKEDANLNNTYLLLLARLDSSETKTGALYNDLNPKYLKIKTCYGQARILITRITETTRYLVSAHKELIKLLQAKNGKPNAKNIAAFNEKVNQLTDLIKQFKTKN